jgi:hypothetical protein
LKPQNSKKGDRQRTPRSPFGLPPKRPQPSPPREPLPAKIVATVAVWTGNSLARSPRWLLPMLESLLMVALAFLLWLELRGRTPPSLLP